jgi:hypothetical protein
MGSCMSSKSTNSISPNHDGKSNLAASGKK